MATVGGYGNFIQKGVFQFSVEGMAGADNSAPIDAGNFEERSVHVYGTFATVGAVTIQGRNSTSSDAGWNTMQTPTGGDVSFTASGFAEIETPALQYRVLNTCTGTATEIAAASLNVIFLFRD